jgi:hypothetical protein
MSVLADARDRPGRVLTRAQALEEMSPKALEWRLGRQWQVVLPGVYATRTGGLSDDERMRAALLYAGADAMLDDLSALRFYRARYLPTDGRVFVLVPFERRRQSRDFVVVRRTRYLPQPVSAAGGLPIAPLSRALADFALRLDDERTVRAVLMSAVQMRHVPVSELDAQIATASTRGLRRYTRVLDEIHAGVRSVGEGDIRTLVARSSVLPCPRYNALLRLPDGRKVSPDLLIEDAALVHETNGRAPHYEDEDEFDSLQERHDAMTTGGLTVLHNSPRLIASSGGRILRQLEVCYLRDAGRGLPPGVVLLRPGAA